MVIHIRARVTITWKKINDDGKSYLPLNYIVRIESLYVGVIHVSKEKKTFLDKRHKKLAQAYTFSKEWRYILSNKEAQNTKITASVYFKELDSGFVHVVGTNVGKIDVYWASVGPDGRIGGMTITAVFKSGGGSTRLFCFWE